MQLYWHLTPNNNEQDNTLRVTHIAQAGPATLGVRGPLFGLGVTLSKVFFFFHSFIAENQDSTQVRTVTHKNGSYVHAHTRDNLPNSEIASTLSSI